MTPPSPSPRPAGHVEGIVTSITPACTTRLGALRVTIQTVTLADVAYAVSFADGQSHELYGIGQADENGRFVWNMAIPAKAAVGKATVLAAARNPEKGGGSGKGTFQVAGPEGC